MLQEDGQVTKPHRKVEDKHKMEEKSQGTSAQTASPATGVRTYSRKRKLAEDVASPARSASSPLLSTPARTPSVLIRSSSSSSSPSPAPARGGASKWEDILNSLESSPKKEEEENEGRVPELKRARVDEDDDTAEEAEGKPDEHEEDEQEEEKGQSASIERRGTATASSTPGKKQRTVQLQLHFGAASSPGRASASSPLSLRSPSSSTLKKDCDSPGSAKASRTPTKSGKSRRSKAGDGGAVRQMYLDLGQEKFDWVTCSVCEMLYAPGVPSDEKTHNAFHQRFLKMQASTSAPRESRTSAW